MSPIRVSARGGRRKLTRTTYGVKPVTLPTFAFYDHLSVVYIDGELIVGRRAIPRERRQ
jgi:hypothetical protein